MVGLLTFRALALRQSEWLRAKADCEKSRTPPKLVTILPLTSDKLRIKQRLYSAM